MTRCHMWCCFLHLCNFSMLASYCVCVHYIKLFTQKNCFWKIKNKFCEIYFWPILLYCNVYWIIFKKHCLSLCEMFFLHCAYSARVLICIKTFHSTYCSYFLHIITHYKKLQALIALITFQTLININTK